MHRQLGPLDPSGIHPQSRRRGPHPRLFCWLNALGAGASAIVEITGDLNYATDGLSSQSWDDYAGAEAPKMDIVITVCGSAAGETCPIWPMTNGNAPVQVHWGIPDPAAAPQPDWPEAFQSAYDALSRKALALMALPFETMTQADLRTSLGRIADV